MSTHVDLSRAPVPPLGGNALVGGARKVDSVLDISLHIVHDHSRFVRLVAVFGELKPSDFGAIMTENWVTGGTLLSSGQVLWGSASEYGDNVDLAECTISATRNPMPKCNCCTEDLHSDGCE